MNKKDDKFKFVSSEEFVDLEETLEEDNISNKTDELEVEVALDEMQIVKDAKLDEVKPIENMIDNDEEVLEFEFVEDDLVEEKVFNDVPEKNREQFKRRLYIGFETRVVASILIVLFFFLGACYFVLEACNYGKSQMVAYNEKSSVDYAVCVENSAYYTNSCLGENLQYLSNIVDTVEATFKYNVKLSEVIDYDLAYHIVGYVKIYDRKDNNKIFYENEELLVESVDISDVLDEIDLERKVEIDYKNYNAYVNGYKNRYKIDAVAELEVILYLDEPEEIRNVASFKIPLGENSFGISKSVVSSKNKEVKIDNDVWNDYNVMCAVLASTFIIVALFILFRTTRLVLKVTTIRSKYEIRLAHILKAYDALIVNTKDGYAINLEKQMVKVESFEELVDAAKVLGKPILYSKINAIKSEFVVEDSEKIYCYVLKEADIK